MHYALGLHMHQPPGNLQLLIDSNEWEAQQIIRCYERAARYAHLYKDVARFHVDFSGVLLAQFKDPAIIDRYRKYIDIPAMIQSYRDAKNIEIIGMGYYHPIFPLIPREDWQEQLALGRAIALELFGRSPKGFWPSEMAFSMEMIPALAAAGYEYVVVDHVHVKPVKESQKINPFTPYLARYGESTITIIPRHRDISNAQESGMNPSWFLNEAEARVKEFSGTKNPLLTSWSDGENGGWFRQIDEASGFFGYFFAPLMEKIRSKEARIKPVTISEFIKKYPPKEEATVKTGAWNVGSTSGYDFSQWNGSGSQKKAINALFEVSKRYWELKKSKQHASRLLQLAQARQLILDAETSCYLFWGDAWIPKLYEKVNAAQKLLA